MSKPRILGTVEWTDWDHLPIDEATKAPELPHIPFSGQADDTPAPSDSGHDHGANGLDFGPPPSSAVSLIISGQVSVQPPYLDDDDTGTSGVLLPVHTPEWTNPSSENPGRTLDKLATEDAVTKKVSLTIPGQISTPPIYLDDEEADFCDMDDLLEWASAETDPNGDASPEHLSAHGVLLDFDDDAAMIDEVLQHLSEPANDPDDSDTTPDDVQTPTEPEPPAPHAMAQFILIVGMADAPSNDTASADDGGITAGIV